ncbi:S-locus glycoprotein [Senna tora]|uniref:S-locus glycoprotein n=1 Tax=Senna tora TaxID=362788 RepID=A0A834SQB4_9FABA|nr:S-locus glycoprotein [Senna tora]
MSGVSERGALAERRSRTRSESRTEAAFDRSRMEKEGVAAFLLVLNRESLLCVVSVSDPQRYETLEEIAAKNRKIFSFETLDAATTNFGDCIGKGGFGAVYKGRLKNGKEIAVKKLSNTTLHTSGRRMAYELHTNGRSLEFLNPAIVDPTVTDTDQVIKCIEIALLCVQVSVTVGSTIAGSKNSKLLPFVWSSYAYCKK